MNREGTYNLLGAYALDAVDAAERRAVDVLLAASPEHHAELASLRATAGALSVLTAVEPPARLREAVLADVRQSRPLPPIVAADDETLDDETPGVTPLRARRHRRRGSWRWAAPLAAAAAAVAVVAWSPWRVPGPDGSTPPSVSSADPVVAVLSSPDAETFTMRMGGQRATVTRSGSLRRAVIQADGMAAPPAGRVYQAWYEEPGGGMRPAGVVRPDADGAVRMVLDGSASGAIGVGVTLEPSGGSEEPTGDPLGLVRFA